MEWIQMPLGPVQTNCYILKKEDGTCLIVDPGNEGEKVIAVLKEQGLTPVAIVLTHAHFDHIGAIDTVREAYRIPVYVHEKEQDWLTSPDLNCSNHMRVAPVQVNKADELISGEQELTLGSFTFQIFETPGHSPGSISLYFKEEGIACVGDALFNGSIGRTDLPHASHEQLLKSIHDKLLTLPEETVVLPGHNATTTIGNEMNSNPFLNGF